MTRCNTTAPKTKKISAVKGEDDFKILAKGQDFIVLFLISTQVPSLTNVAFTKNLLPHQR